jgi:hypothetical protein
MSGELTYASKRPQRMVFPLVCGMLFAVISFSDANESAAAETDSAQWSSSLAQIRFPATADNAPIDRSMLYKIAGVVCSTLVVSFICWFVAYPVILRKGNTWPVTLYGRCTAVAWCLSWLIALVVFSDDLPIEPRDTFLRAQGLRWLMGIIAVFFAVVWLLIWRSEKQA